MKKQSKTSGPPAASPPSFEDTIMRALDDALISALPPMLRAGLLALHFAKRPHKEIIAVAERRRSAMAMLHDDPMRGALLMDGIRAFLDQLATADRKLAKLRVEVDAYLRRWVAAGKPLSDWPCPACTGVNRTTRPDEESVNERGQWDSSTNCLYCGAMAMVARRSDGSVVVNGHEFAAQPTVDDLNRRSLESLGAFTAAARKHLGDR